MSVNKSNPTALEFFTSRPDDYLKKYQRNADLQERLKVWHGALDEFVRPEMSVLDLGCGDGIFSYYAQQQGASVIGVDGSTEMIERCEARAGNAFATRPTFEHATIPFERDEWRQSFDVVMSSSVLEYVADIDAAIGSIGEWTKPGGIALVSLPNWKSLYRKCERLMNRCLGPVSYCAYVRNFLNVDELSSRFDAAGFDRLRVEYFARNKRISRYASALGMGDRWCGNLYLGVFRKRR